MRVLMQAAGLSALLVAVAPAQAATPEETLYHWGECAVAGGIYQAAINGGSTNATLPAKLERYEALTPRMEKIADPLADSLGEEKTAAVSQRLQDNYKFVFETWDGEGDFGDFAVSKLGALMDRCLREADALPAA